MDRVAYISFDRAKIEELTAFLSRRPEILIQLLSISQYHGAVAEVAEYAADVVLIDGASVTNKDCLVELCAQIRAKSAREPKCVLILPEDTQQFSEAAKTSGAFDEVIAEADVKEYLIQRYGS